MSSRCASTSPSPRSTASPSWSASARTTPGMILRALDQGARRHPGAAHRLGRRRPRAGRRQRTTRRIGTRGFATYSRAGRFGTDGCRRPPRLVPARDTLVLGMIESPAGVAAAREIVGTAGPRRHHDRPGRPGCGIRPDDLPVAEATARVQRGDRRRGQAPHGHRRARPMPRPRRSTTALELVVYNLASSLMAHLKGLLAPRA